MITTLRDYFILAVILLALAVTGYIEVSKLLTKLSNETVTQLRVRG